MHVKRRNISLLFSSLIFTLLAGVIGSFFTETGANSWYQTINKPSFNPPDFLFAPVWTALFILMGVSLYLVLKKIDNIKKYKVALIWFSVQWLLNILWSFFFFYLENPLFGLIEIGLLIISIVLTIRYFYSINKLASYLLIPYLLWVLWAAVLNYYILILN